MPQQIKSHCDSLVSPFPPSTSFGNDVSSIDWKLVVVHEAHNVATWLAYLNYYQYDQTHRLVKVLDATLRDISEEQWAAYDKAHLPCTLMHMVSMQGLFCTSTDPTDIRDVAYSNAILRLLLRYIGMLNSHEVTESHDRTLNGHVLEKMEMYSIAMGAHRHLIPKRTDLSDQSLNPKSDGSRFATMMASVAIGLTDLYEYKFHRPPPWSSAGYVANVLFYYWTYHASGRDLHRILSYVSRILLASKKADVRNFLEATILNNEDDDDYKRHFAEKVSVCLRDETFSSYHAGCILTVCRIMVCELPRAFTSIPMAEDRELLPALVVGSLRQMCSSSDDEAQTFVFEALRTIQIILSVAHAQSARQFNHCVFGLNMCSVLGFAIVVAIRQANKTELDKLLLLLKYTLTMTRQAESRPTMDEMLRAPRKFANATWQSTLATIHAIPAKRSEQTKMKDQAVRGWIDYGTFFGLKFRPAIQSPQGPSKLSNKPYREIERRCFWGACACAHDRPFHHLRVCTGCWHVLYCSTKCQKL
ncbi:hypothetical protein EIP91_010363 [Steccherinum ochraceum]|uniref:MYND-type domain-containing protein n=1 Tax=Steccherinum ochraceum TaxID=92696 RepID=A0A4R0RCW6_9APHY|nr:hypothetical protein EIP91_010363 [Steccherinum ochraceum]